MNAERRLKELFFLQMASSASHHALSHLHLLSLLSRYSVNRNFSAVIFWGGGGGGGKEGGLPIFFAGLVIQDQKKP